MTAQISDTFIYRNKSFYLAGIKGLGLFDPAHEGVKAVAVSTSNWRGFSCVYEVAEGVLYLIQVNLGLDKDDYSRALQGTGPKLFGKVPRQYTIHGHRSNCGSGEVKTSWESEDYMVDGLREIMPYTGGLLLCDEFIREMYVHMGFHPAYKFKIVHELIFEGGRLVEEHDRSSLMAQVREKQKSLSFNLKHPGNGPDTKPEIMEWISQCFSLEY